MAYETVEIKDASGATVPVLADKIGTDYLQAMKLDIGGDGAVLPVVAGQQAMAASVPVVIASNQSAVPVSAASLPLPSGASTAALQGGGLPAALGAGGGLKVDGSGTALPVSLASVPSHVTTDGGPGWTSAYLHTASADATGTVDVTAAPTSGQKIVIDDIIVSCGSAMALTFEEETSGTDVLVLYMAANSSAQVTPRGRIKLATADKKLRMDASAAGAVAVTVVYHSEA